MVSGPSLCLASPVAPSEQISFYSGFAPSHSEHVLVYLALGGVDLEGVGFRSFANTRVACHVPPCVRHASLVATLCTRRYQRYSGPGRTSSWRLLPRDFLAYAYDSGSPWVSAESVSKRGVIPVCCILGPDGITDPSVLPCTPTGQRVRAPRPVRPFPRWRAGGRDPHQRRATGTRRCLAMDSVC